MKFLLNLSYLLAVLLPILMFYLGYLQHQYNNNDFERLIDRMNGFQRNYIKHNLLFTIIWILSIIFIISYS